MATSIYAEPSFYVARRVNVLIQGDSLDEVQGEIFNLSEQHDAVHFCVPAQTLDSWYAYGHWTVTITPNPTPHITIPQTT